MRINKIYVSMKIMSVHLLIALRVHKQIDIEDDTLVSLPDS